MIGLRCECAGECGKHDMRCENHEGQQDLFGAEDIELFTYRNKQICQMCLPSPIARPVDYHYSIKEDCRLKRQPQLFMFL